jgi:hypothetical protein
MTSKPAIATRTSEYWSTAPARLDALNLRYGIDVDASGIPIVASTSTVPSELAPYSSRRAREYAASTDGVALHYFLDDYRFESVWSSAERVAPRIDAVGISLSPDFSIWHDMPAPLALYQTYRSRWVMAFWQARGVDVIPTLAWGSPSTYSHAFAGIHGGTVAVSSLGVQRRDSHAFAAGMRELIERCEPSTVLSYGALRHCDAIDLPEVVEYPTFWDRRRANIPKPLTS